MAQGSGLALSEPRESKGYQKYRFRTAVAASTITPRTSGRRYHARPTDEGFGVSE
jgi:hypothetical protein